MGKVGNIYFAGPDGVGKTTLAVRLRNFLERDVGLPVHFVQFPTRVGPASILITLHRSGRFHFDHLTLDVLFVADRLDEARRLRGIRSQNPDTVFIFDRGPLDGAAYGVARFLSIEERDMHASWLLGCDRKFLEMFPVHLGFLILASQEFVTHRMEERRLSRPPDIFDRDKRLQMDVEAIFEGLITARPEWSVIKVGSGSALGMEFATIKEEFMRAFKPGSSKTENEFLRKERESL